MTDSELAGIIDSAARAAHRAAHGTRGTPRGRMSVLCALRNSDREARLLYAAADLLTECDVALPEMCKRVDTLSLLGRAIGAGDAGAVAKALASLGV